MARLLRTVGREFVDSAPIRLVFAAEVSAPVGVVYRALAEDVASWPSWFTAVTLAAPTHEGAGREVRLRGGVRFRETIVAAEPDTCYAYRADESNAPGLRALLEEWRLTPEGSGTRVQWTFAADGTGLFRLVLSLARAGVGRSFRDAVRRLDARLATTAP
ncbi:SRPBCC family protein [Streptomyces sp. CA-278952]|uniref:SRPBCC family protein n=1 Tax=unclassified Streptomyces TaxID=2593676 RepID=UPI0022424C19|nr:MULTISPECIES: SRPBCC family protein [unclassified Streptomyces]UZI33042.1 SRPBCC family protein [Streptomyces sp. VB1]WDG32921.1 SRPBCC family protein [Streptomyces sp. CA-278952]